jgi:hypothetical protein
MIRSRPERSIGAGPEVEVEIQTVPGGVHKSLGHGRILTAAGARLQDGRDPSEGPEARAALGDLQCGGVRAR